MLKKIVILLLVSVMSAAAGHARTTEGVEMPETIEIGDKKVALNGAGVREIIDAKYYVGGLYLREAGTDQSAIMEADEPMAIRLEMIENAGQETMQRAFLNGLKGATDNNIDPIQDQVDQFMDCFSDSIKDGDVFEFRYAPEEGTKVYKSGEQLDVIEGLDFKKAMFGIWLSDQPADSGLKEDMLAGDFRVAMEDISDEEKEAEEAGQEDREASQEKEASEQEAEEERKVAEKEADIEKQEQEAAKKRQEAEKEAEDKKADQKDTGAGGAEAAGGSESGDAGGDDEQKDRAEAEQKDRKAGKEAAEEEQKAEKRASREKQKSEGAEAEKERDEEQKASDEEKSGTSATRGEVEGESVYFETNDASLNEKAVKRLEKKAAWLEKNPDADLSVKVYCDPRGSEDYNTWLAKQRGRSVRKWFTGRDIDESRIYIKVRGAEALKGDGEKDLSKSRRAEFRIVE
ncbi:MAG: chalcone isomerase family protein [Desulfobacterales bacterium]